MEEYYPELLKKWKNISKTADGMFAVLLLKTVTQIFRHLKHFSEIFFRQFVFWWKVWKKKCWYLLAWLFRFGWALPTIERHANLIGFTTQKLAWGGAYGIPFDIGKWQGVDGSEVYASINPHDYYYTLKNCVIGILSLISLRKMKNTTLTIRIFSTE